MTDLASASKAATESGGAQSAGAEEKSEAAETQNGDEPKTEKAEGNLLVTEKLASAEKIKALGDVGLKTDQYTKQLAAMRVTNL